MGRQRPQNRCSCSKMLEVQRDRRGPESPPSGRGHKRMDRMHGVRWQGVHKRMDTRVYVTENAQNATGTEGQWRPRCLPRSKKLCNGSIVKMEEKCPLGSFPKPAGSAPRGHSATSKKFKPINA